MKPIEELDDDRQPTRAGDVVRCNYGLPPVGVRAEIIRRGKYLVALTPGHKPAECNLCQLRKYVGAWFKENSIMEPKGKNTL